MSSGPIGFRNAPVTKVLITVIGGCSAISSLFEASRVPVQHPLWRLMSSQCAFSNIGPTVVGTWLIYKLRIIERRYGSSKFAALVFISFAISTLLHQVLGLSFDTTRFTVNGPYALIFAILYQYHLIVPVTYQVPLFMNWTMTDKSYVYAAATQLLISYSPSSIAPCLYGLLSGVIYHSNVGNLKKWRFPSWLRSFCSNYILPFLGSSSRSRPRISTASTSTTHLFTATNSSRVDRSNTDQGLHRRHTSTPNQEVELPPSDENIDVLMAMFPHCSKEVVAEALVNSRQDLNRAAEKLLTTQTPPTQQGSSSSVSRLSS